VEQELEGRIRPDRFVVERTELKGDSRRSLENEAPRRRDTSLVSHHLTLHRGQNSPLCACQLSWRLPDRPHLDVDGWLGGRSPRAPRTPRTPRTPRRRPRRYTKALLGINQVSRFFPPFPFPPSLRPASCIPTTRPRTRTRTGTRTGSRAAYEPVSCSTGGLKN
jgi:hypothetical protein